jgi:glycolate oxidase FAD binding subunit
VGGADRTQALCETVRASLESGGSLRIVGSGSKARLTRGTAEPAHASSDRLLSLAEHAGVIAYRPEELVITARAGTPLRELEWELARAGQHLPFEPPRFHGGGTLGGAVACGLAGPGRPWRGSVRDAVLGLELINGKGEHVRFGGQVMKNVAGYDLARLQVGAFGTLGVILAVSLKVMPRPALERTREFATDGGTALRQCRTWAREPHPITATCYHQGVLRIRLSGAEAAVSGAVKALGGDKEGDGAFWDALRDHRLPLFAGDGLWRASVPPASPWLLEDSLITWGGAERWWCEDDDPALRVRTAADQGVQARPFDGRFGVRIGDHLDPLERRYAERLRDAFDPRHLFNRDLVEAHAD